MVCTMISGAHHLLQLSLSTDLFCYIHIQLIDAFIQSEEKNPLFWEELFQFYCV